MGRDGGRAVIRAREIGRHGETGRAATGSRDLNPDNATTRTQHAHADDEKLAEKIRLLGKYIIVVREDGAQVVTGTGGRAQPLSGPDQRQAD